MREAENCELCGRAVMRVRVNGVEQMLDSMQIACVKLDQKPWAQYLTGRIVLGYPHHDAMCTDEAKEAYSAGQDSVLTEEKS